MVSAFQSREFGWGMEIDDDQLAVINAQRHGNDYFDAAAAMEVNRTSTKPPLAYSPFIILFKFGGRNGYWTGNHMILQTEDCIDCLQAIFESRYDFVFLFDHSSGHAMKQAGGLSVASMTKGFGGEMLRNTKLNSMMVTLAHITTQPILRWCRSAINRCSSFRWIRTRKMALFTCPPRRDAPRGIQRKCYFHPRRPVIRIVRRVTSLTTPLYRLRKRKVTVGVRLRKSWHGGFDNHKVPR